MRHGLLKEIERLTLGEANRTLNYLAAKAQHDDDLADTLENAIGHAKTRTTIEAGDEIDTPNTGTLPF